MIPARLARDITLFDMEKVSGAIMRLHGPLNLRTVDRIMAASGYAFIATGLLLLATTGNWRAGVVGVFGGLVIRWRARLDRRDHACSVWLLAAGECDPIDALARYEYLYRLRFRDLRAIAVWRAGRDAVGLPPDDSDLDAPPEVRTMFDYLRAIPREG